MLSVLEGLDSGVVLTVEGEPGIGKSRLLSELAAAADERRFLVLEGRGNEGELDVPFGPCLDALDDYLGSVNPRTLQPADAEGRNELARIFPSLAELGDANAAAVQEERYRSHRAVRTMLEGLAARQPVLLTIDDAHWADSASIELLSHMVRHPPRARLVLAIGLRPAQAPERLRAELGTAQRIELSPLADEQAVALLGDLDDEPAVREVLRRSGGNPFYLEQLAREWAATGDLQAGAPGAEPGGVPGDVASAIAGELQRLDSDALRLLQGAAIVGEGFDPELAATAAGLAPADALDPLDRLLDGDLIRAGDVPRRFRFRHPIVRQAVYASAPAGWSLGAHARVASALADRGASAATQAGHLERSAPAGDDGAVATLTEAGDDASARAPAAAAHWYAAALRLVAETDVSRRLALLVPRARALAACGRYEDALADLAEVLELMPPDDPVLRGRVIASAAKVKQLIGRHGEAKRELTGALEALHDPGSSEASTLKLELAADSFFTGDQESFERWVNDALYDSRGRGDKPMIAAATGLHSAALYMRDDVAGARVEFDAALALIEELDDEALTAHLNAHTWTALGAVCLERFDEATALLDRTIDAALAAGQGHLPTLMRTTQALAWINQGRLRPASIQLDAAVEASILTRNPVFLAWARSLQCWTTLVMGDLPGAVRLIDLAESGVGDDPLSATGACYLAEARLAAGDPAAARDEIIARAGGADLPRIERGFRARGFELLARASLALGDHPEAERWAEQAGGEAAGLEIAGRTADALRARSEVRLAMDDGPGARAAAEEAVAIAAEGGLAIDAGRARILAGRAARAEGEEASARDLLERARDDLAELGAGYYADAAARELRKLGVRVSRAERAPAVAAGLDELSAREREIAELVAAGRRNNEIAESLFLSVRTVEGHLARTFRKLDVSSRTQLAALVSAAAGDTTDT
jgi:DNA-binding CsgD family transcriptional regulator